MVAEQSVLGKDPPARGRAAQDLMKTSPRAWQGAPNTQPGPLSATWEAQLVRRCAPRDIALLPARHPSRWV